MAYFWRLISISLLSFILMSCSGDSNHNEAQGYMEGRYTYIATSVSGAIQQLLVKRGDVVKRGQLLFVLEAQPESDAYEAAVENYQQAINSRDAISANLVYAKLTYDRNKILVEKHAIQQALLDNARSNFDALTAQLAQANANIASTGAAEAEAKWRLGQKKVVAPIDGIVFDTYYYPGEYSTANQAILSLLAPENNKAIFYVKQPILGSLRLRDKVTVSCDGCTQTYPGFISFISPTAEYTPPVIFSEKTNEKLVYRIEAQFEPKYAVQLHPGQPVRVTYYPHE